MSTHVIDSQAVFDKALARLEGSDVEPIDAEYEEVPITLDVHTVDALVRLINDQLDDDSRCQLFDAIGYKEPPPAPPMPVGGLRARRGFVKQMEQSYSHHSYRMGGDPDGYPVIPGTMELTLQFDATGDNVEALSKLLHGGRPVDLVESE